MSKQDDCHFLWITVHMKSWAVTLCKSNSSETNKNTCLHTEFCKNLCGEKKGKYTLESPQHNMLPMWIWSACRSMSFEKKAKPDYKTVVKKAEEGSSRKQSMGSAGQWKGVEAQPREFLPGFSTCCSLNLKYSSPTYFRDSIPHSIKVSTQRSLPQKGLP